MEQKSDDLQDAIALLGAFALVEAGDLILASIAPAVAGAVAAGLLLTPAGLVGVGLVVTVSVVVAGANIALGIENLEHHEWGTTPISNATGINLPIFTPYRRRGG